MLLRHVAAELHAAGSQAKLPLEQLGLPEFLGRILSQTPSVLS